MATMEHVEAALDIIRSASEMIGKMAAVEPSWQVGALAKLNATDALLRATTDRFFLKTRASLPPARKVQEQAESLAGALAEPAPDVHKIGASLEALERAVKALDERSLMQGFTVT